MPVFIIANQMQLEPINKRITRSGRQPTFQQVSRAVRAWLEGGGGGAKLWMI